MVALGLIGIRASERPYGSVKRIAAPEIAADHHRVA
jgi:hypothetical protein